MKLGGLEPWSSGRTKEKDTGLTPKPAGGSSGSVSLSDCTVKYLSRRLSTRFEPPPTFSVAVGGVTTPVLKNVDQLGSVDLPVLLLK